MDPRGHRPNDSGALSTRPGALWARSLEDVGGIATIHALIEDGERIRFVRLLVLLDMGDNGLLHTRGDLPGAADKDLEAGSRSA